MSKLKLTCWNVEWMDKLWPNVVESKFHVDRRIHVANEINIINADVLCLEEGPRDPADMQSYVDEFLPNYQLVTRNEGNDWGINGQQWIYFIVKSGSVDNAYMMPIAEWYEKVPRSWPVYFWGDLEESDHDHYRLP